MSGVPSAQELDRLQYCTQSICRSSRMGESFDHDGRDERDALFGAASNAFVVVNLYPGAHMCLNFVVLVKLSILPGLQ